MVENKWHGDYQRAYKEQGGIQISGISQDQVIIVFVSNLLVDGPEVCCRVDVVRRGSQVRDCLLQPEEEQCRLDPRGAHQELEGRPTGRFGSLRLHEMLKVVLEEW